MKIKKMLVGNFGKLKNYELDLKDGFQVIYGKNEDGKSTLMAFIKMMFYSKQQAGRDIDKNPRKKYQPWDGSTMNGAIEFEHEGVSYRLQKDFGATPGSDKVKLINLNTGISVQLGKNEEVGKRFFGLDLAGFERSVFIGNLGGLTGSSNNDEVADKLIANLVSSGDERISHQLALKRINDAMDEMQSKRGGKGSLVEARDKLHDLITEKGKVEEQGHKQKDSMNEYHRLKAKLEEQKEVQELIKLSKAKSRYESLKALIKDITSYMKEEKALEKDNFSFEKLQNFLQECSVLKDEAENAKAVQQELEASLQGSKEESTLVPISEEEHQYLKQLYNEERKYKELLKRVQEVLIPAFTSYMEAKENYDKTEKYIKDEEDLLKKLEGFHEEFKSCEEQEKTKIDEMQRLNGDFGRDRFKWDIERELRKGKIKLAQEKAAFQPVVNKPVKEESKTSNSLLLISVIIAVLSIILSFAAGRWLALGLIPAVIMGIYAFKGQKQSSPVNEAVENYISADGETDLKQLEKENEEEEARIKNAAEEYENRINSLSKLIEGFEKKLDILSEKNEAYDRAVGNHVGLMNDKNNAFNILDIRESSYNRERNSLFEEHSEKVKLLEALGISITSLEAFGEAEYVNFEKSLREHCEILVEKLQKKLEEKCCTSVQEYEDMFLKFTSNLNNLNAVRTAEEEFKKKSERFLEKFSEYERAGSYEEGKGKLDKLGERVYSLLKEEKEALYAAKGMGYADVSLDYLLEEQGRLLPSVKLLEDKGGDALDLEALEQRQRELGDEDLHNKLLDLKDSIRTPERGSSQIEEEIQELKKEVDEKTEHYESLKLALEVMQEASDEMMKSFGPELNRRTASIFQRLTNGKYGSVFVSKDYDISIQSGIHYREWKYLSSGTIDQAYLSLRLAITELISDKSSTLPLFLDDVLIQYDDERVKTALGFLSSYAEEKGEEFQLLMFTCHKHIVEHTEDSAGGVVNI